MATSPRGLLQQARRIAAERQRAQDRRVTAAERDMRFLQLMAAVEAGDTTVHPRIVEILNRARARRDAAMFADLA